MPNALVPAAATGLPPRRLKIEDEFLSLIDERRRITAHLDELVDILAPDFAPTSPRSDMLPLSGLRLVGRRPGVALYKGGRAHG